MCNLPLKMNIFHPLSRRASPFRASCSGSLKRGIASEAVPRPVPSIPSAPSTKYKTATHKVDSDHISERTQATLTRAKEYILPVYARPDFVLSHGKGSYVWDTEGKKYLDFSAGIAVNALGHADEGVSKVLTEQSQKLLHTSNVYHNEWAAKLAELLVTLTQKEGGLGYSTEKSATDGNTPGVKVFFSNSGTEANEGALKIARKVGKDRWAANASGRSWDSKDCTKTRIACFESSFHGRSMGALSVTSTAKYQLPFAPLLPGIDVGKVNDFDGLSSLVGEDTCAVIVEPIQGEGGINAAHTEWLIALRKRCDEVGAVLIFDEIQCGLYRTGTLWAHSPLPVECHPDIVTMAKPLANGYPIGSVLIRDSVASTMTAGTHGTTFGGSPIACAVGFHVLSRLSDRPFVAQIAETSAYLSGRLSQLPKWFPDILQPTIRGKGLILGLGFKDEKNPGRLVSLARERGVFVLTAGRDAVRLVPSLNVGKTEVDLAVDVIESCLGEMQ
ncbi:acetylornithine aminotransferase [Lentinula guzmanii]|uniref:Acetylornithine aminotransferase n=1 Tax=Lentinula guzmanii TaxID=2804957 RepID=A0AA38J7S1_9AGAR|nr:acetylornithine aminotransferase [Lentinula guzmanii]